MIDGVVNADALPALERLMQFAGARHRVIANNIANLDTPGFRPVDVSVRDFQRSLGEAIDAGREQHGAAGGELRPRDTDDVAFHDRGLALRPRPAADGILFYDGNDRDLETIMQDMVENFFAFRTAAQLMRSRFGLINTAISERV